MRYVTFNPDPTAGTFQAGRVMWNVRNPSPITTRFTTYGQEKEVAPTVTVMLPDETMVTFADPVDDAI
jgi:hypothetical protein